MPYELNQENLANHNTSTNEHSSRPSASRQSTNASTASFRPAYAGVSSAKLKAWQAVGGSYSSSTTKSTSGAQFTGYDGDGNPHQRTRSPSTIASGDEDDGEESDNTTTAERSHNAKAMDEKAFVSTEYSVSQCSELISLSRKLPRASSQSLEVKEPSLFRSQPTRGVPFPMTIQTTTTKKMNTSRFDTMVTAL